MIGTSLGLFVFTFVAGPPVAQADVLLDLVSDDLGRAHGAGPSLRPTGDVPALGPRLEQDDVLLLSLLELRREGRRVFSTPFNALDGFGDGPVDPADTTSPGGRPTLGGNGRVLRVNGLDSQTCVECHGMLSTRSIPPTFAVGGHGGMAASAMPGTRELDVDDGAANGFAFFDGRLINPPFLFGSGGVELLAKEMTRELQALKAQAEANPGTSVVLVTKGVNFGKLLYDDVLDEFDTSGIVGLDPDLVVRPFGRKGDNATVRRFALGAMPFHHGIEPAELTDDLDGDGVPDPGIDIDADGDGVFNEILPGELSALHVFAVLTEKPRVQPASSSSMRGLQRFQDAGCATCHLPVLETDTTLLPIAFPEVETDPDANVFREVELLGGAAGFNTNGAGGLRIALFSDLKRHHMGAALEESTGGALDPWFVTARLWGLADTAPYMHDGRALTIREAILAHGGEAAAAAAAFQAFQAFPTGDQLDLVAFLERLRTPLDPNADL